MGQYEMRLLCRRMVEQARALREAFPDVDVMSGLPVGPLPDAALDESAAASEYRAALRYLRDEMYVVQAGKAADLTVLDDEIAYTESLLTRERPC